MEKVEINVNVVSEILEVSVNKLRGIVNYPDQPDAKNEDKQ